MDSAETHPTGGKYSWVAPMAVFVTALAIRCIYIAIFRRTEIWDAMMVDAELYDNWGVKIAGGDWIGTKIFYDPPLYAYFLGVIYKIFGHSYLWLRIIQAIIGSVHAVLIFYLAEKISDRRAGLIAGLIAAFYKLFVFYDALVMKEFLSSTVVDAGLLAFLIALKSGKYRWWFLHGIFLGLTTLLRLNILLFVFIELLIFLFALMTDRWKGGRLRAFSSIILWFTGFSLMIAPAVARNWYISGKFVLVSSYLGQNLYTGNNPYNTNGNYQRLSFVRANPKYEEDDFSREASNRLGIIKLTPNQVSMYWLGEAIFYIRAQPMAFLKRLWVRFRFYWNAYEVPDSHNIYYLTKYYLPIFKFLPGFGIIAPLGLIGIAFTWRKRNELWPLYVFICVYSVSVIIFFVFGRYRLPMVGILVAFAGVTPVRLWEIKSRRKYFISIIAVMAAFFVLINVSPPYRILESDYFRNMGSLFRQRGETERAIDYYRKAISIDPSEFESQYFLATTLRENGKCDEAMKQYRITLGIRPDDPNSYAGIGMCYEKEGKDDKAYEYYMKALDREAQLSDVRLILVKLLLRNGDKRNALIQLKLLETVDPKNPEVIGLIKGLGLEGNEIP